MSNKINTNIPANTVIGARQISNQVRNLDLSREAKDYLAQIGGILRLEFSSDGNGPTHSIIGRDGKFLATTREFEQLANYKSFISKKKEDIEEAKGIDEQIAIYHNLMIRYETIHGVGSIPARMLEANSSKFGQIKKSVELTEKHLRVIDTLPTSIEKIYLMEKGTLLMRVQIQGLIECMGPTKYEQSLHEEKILGLGIPKFIENKFTDQNFTKDVRNDAKPLLFPRGNFNKALSFTTAEIASDGFMNANSAVITHSYSIIQLAKSDALRDWFIPVNSPLRDEMVEQWNKVQWPMLDIGNMEEYLTPRLNRVNVKPFSPTQPPRAKPGQKAVRPETPFQKEVRDLKNQLGKLLSVIIDFYHFIPRVEDPIEDFWRHVVNTNGWIMSPERTLYDWVNDAPNRDTVLNAMKNNELVIMRRMMADIVGMNLEIPSRSFRFRELEQIILGTGPNTTLVNYADNPPVANFLRNLTMSSMEDLKNTTHLTDEVHHLVRTFRGKATEEALKKNDDGKGMIGKSKINKTTRSLIKGIVDKKLRASIEKWIKESFRDKKMQELAAEYAAMAIEDENLGYEESEEESSEEEDD